jgi:hypothetical protein
LIACGTLTVFTRVAVAVTLAAHIKAPADALLLVDGKAAIQISLRLRNQKGVHTQRL